MDALPSKRIHEDEAESDNSGQSIDDEYELEVTWFIYYTLKFTKLFLYI